MTAIPRTRRTIRAVTLTFALAVSVARLFADESRDADSFGKLRVESSVPCGISLDGTELGTVSPETPLYLEGLSSGVHAITVVRDGQEPVVRRIRLAAGAVVTFLVPAAGDGPLPEKAPETEVAAVDRELGTEEAVVDPIILNTELGFTMNMRGTEECPEGDMDGGFLVGVLAGNSRRGIGVRGCVTALEARDSFFLGSVDLNFALGRSGVFIRPALGLGTNIKGENKALIYAPGVAIAFWRLAIHAEFVNFEYFGARDNPRFPALAISYSIPNATLKLKE